MDRPLFQPHEFPPGCNVALAMGRQPNGDWLLGIDIDGTVDVQRYFGCELPPTLETTSGRGRHYIYRVRKEADYGNWIDLFSTRCETGYKPSCAGSVDLRYARGALVVAPSRHRSGAHYKTAGEVTDLPTRASLTIYTARLRAGKRPDARWHGFKEGKCP
jgi:hypothetical protein